MFKDAINRKIKILKDFGIDNRSALRDYLTESTKGCPVEAFEIRLDNICRGIITRFFEGDRTFCY